MRKKLKIYFCKYMLKKLKRQVFKMKNKTLFFKENTLWDISKMKEKDLSIL